MCPAELPWRRGCSVIRGAPRALFLSVFSNKAPFGLPPMTGKITLSSSHTLLKPKLGLVSVLLLTQDQTGVGSCQTPYKTPPPLCSCTTVARVKTVGSFLKFSRQRENVGIFLGNENTRDNFTILRVFKNKII